MDFYDDCSHITSVTLCKINIKPVHNFCFRLIESFDSHYPASLHDSHYLYDPHQSLPFPSGTGTPTQPPVT